MNYTVVNPLDYVDEKTLGFNLKTKRKNKFIRGGLYRLKQKVCIDSTMCHIVEKTYRLIGIVHQIGEMNFDGVVMKQLTGEKSNMTFTLSKSQCLVLHIKYQPNLEVFPMGTKFDRIIEKFPNEEEFNIDDMSTYPHCPIDGTYRQIYIRLNDFILTKKNNKNAIKNKVTKKYYNFSFECKEKEKDFHIISINGITVKSKVYLKSDDFPIDSKKRLMCFLPNEEIPYKVWVDNENNIFLVLELWNSVIGGFTEDGFIGIDKKSFKDKKFEDLFDIIDFKEK